MKVFRVPRKLNTQSIIQPSNDFPQIITARFSHFLVQMVRVCAFFKRVRKLTGYLSCKWRVRFEEARLIFSRVIQRRGSCKRGGWQDNSRYKGWCPARCHGAEFKLEIQKRCDNPDRP